MQEQMYVSAQREKHVEFKVTLRENRTMKLEVLPHTAMNRLQKQILEVDSSTEKLRRKDSMLFKKLVDAMQRHDAVAAKVFSTELAVIRRVIRNLNYARTRLIQMEGYS